METIDHRIVLPDGTERKRAEEAVQKSEAELRRLSSQILEVSENEHGRYDLLRATW